MEDCIVIHIPHASLNLPKHFLEALVVEESDIQEENRFLSDYGVDEFLPRESAHVVAFDYSRMFCDVERFKDDEAEEMAKYGQGVLYTKDSNGRVFIEFDEDYRQKVLSEYYDKHHERLDEIATQALRENGICYIVDLHSFSDEFIEKFFQKSDNPDICLGYDSDYADLELIDLTKKHFKEYGFTIKDNYPYGGSIVPNRYFGKKNSGVYSLMLEINKRVYLDENKSRNAKKASRLKECIDAYYEVFNAHVRKKKISKSN